PFGRESRAATMRLPRVGASSTSGRGDSVDYREGDNTAVFDWEFGAPPALALIFGADAEAWDRRYPWRLGGKRKSTTSSRKRWCVSRLQGMGLQSILIPAP